MTDHKPDLHEAPLRFMSSDSTKASNVFPNAFNTHMNHTCT